jgi:hypothetical protein
MKYEFVIFQVLTAANRKLVVFCSFTRLLGATARKTAILEVGTGRNFRISPGPTSIWLDPEVYLHICFPYPI